MPISPYTVEYNYLHECENGPIYGDKIRLTGVPGNHDVIQIAEIFVWDRPQPEDHSELHGRKVTGYNL